MMNPNLPPKVAMQMAAGSEGRGGNNMTEEDQAKVLKFEPDHIASMNVMTGVFVYQIQDPLAGLTLRKQTKRQEARTTGSVKLDSVSISGEAPKPV
jgi:hypothetical protein